MSRAQNVCASSNQDGCMTTTWQIHSEKTATVYVVCHWPKYHHVVHDCILIDSFSLRAFSPELSTQCPRLRVSAAVHHTLGFGLRECPCLFQWLVFGFCRTGSPLHAHQVQAASSALTERGCSLSFLWRHCKAQVGAAVVLMLLMLLWAGEAGGWCCCVRHVCWLKRSILFSASVLSSSHPHLQVPDCHRRVWLLTLNILWSRHFLSRDWRASRKCQESRWWWGDCGEQGRVGGSAKKEGAKRLLKQRAWPHRIAGLRGEPWARSQATLSVPSFMWLLGFFYFTHFYHFIFNRSMTYYMDQSNLKFTIPLPQPPEECWDCSHVPPCLASSWNYKIDR